LAKTPEQYCYFLLACHGFGLRSDFNLSEAMVGCIRINSAVFQVSPTIALLAHSHKLIGGSGFVASDSGFSHGTLAPGETAVYSIDALVLPTTKATLASLSMEVNADGIISTPARALMPIIAAPASAPQPRVWLALALGG
jgi:hypothetical protein